MSILFKRFYDIILFNTTGGKKHCTVDVTMELKYNNIFIFLLS